MGDKLTILECQSCDGSLSYLIPIAILIGLAPYYKLNLWQRRKVIFTTIGIGVLIALNDWIVTYIQFKEMPFSTHEFLHHYAIIAILYGMICSICSHSNLAPKYYVFLLPLLQVFASIIAIICSLENNEGIRLVFSPSSFSSELFFLFWNSYTPLFPLNAYMDCGFFTPKNWLYFIVFQVFFNTLYLLFISYLSHSFYKYWHRNIAIEPK